jgi:hypothetical protein
VKDDPTREILGCYKQLMLHDANEANTRLKVIDRILREVLGWSFDDISVEDSVTEDGKTTYSDYVLKTANTAFVVEAKKAGATFSARSFVGSKDRRVKLSKGFLESDLGQAIVQARDYGRKQGIDFAVATNGSVWAVFPAQRHDRVKFQESTALIFWSLEDALSENYQEFHDLLSRGAVISGSLDRRLFGRPGNQVDERKLRSFFETRISHSNPLFPMIEDAVTKAFSDSIVELPDESFQLCYVTVPDPMKFDHKIRMYITRRQQVVSAPLLRPMKRRRDEQEIVSKFHSTTTSRKDLAILLLGSVGSGKTTFLHHMRNICLGEIFLPHPDRPYPYWLYLDFLDCSPSESVRDFIYKRLLSYILQDAFLRDYDKCLQHAYASQIEALRCGPFAKLDGHEFNRRIADLMQKDYEKIHPYVDNILKYATKNVSFFLVIDNVDQVEDDTLQSRLFTEAFAIAKQLSLNLILSLRQSTFVKHRDSPTINAFDFDTIQIDPPKITSVLAKRFALAQREASGKSGQFTAENGMRFDVQDAAQLVKMIQESVLGTEIGDQIEVLSTEDVRLALRMTRQFLERGYTDPGRAWRAHQRKGKYLFPRHEAFRAIILGLRTVYDEQTSSIGNPFDARLAVSGAQLLRLFVLSAIVTYASEKTFRFIEGTTIRDRLIEIGFGESYTERVLGDLCKHRFLFTTNHGEAAIASSFLVSRLGGHIVRSLITNFTFLENMLFDTYIADQITWQNLQQLSKKIETQRNKLSRIKLRVERVRAFYSYMQECLNALVTEALKRGLPTQWCCNVMEERKHDLDLHLDQVMFSAQKNYGPGGRYESLQHDLIIDNDEDFDAVDDVAPPA